MARLLPVEDNEANRALLRRRHIALRLARPQFESSKRLGSYRRVAERDVARLHRNRRLLVRHERHAEVHDAFLALGRALSCRQCLHRDGSGETLQPQSAPGATVGA